MKRFLSFALVSISVSLLDIFLFWLLADHFLTEIAYPLIWSTVIARIISASINYVINRQVVFRSHEDYRKSSVQFLILSIVQCALSAALVHILKILFGAEPVLLKVIVDTLLFFANYVVQHKFIFISQ